MAKIKINGDSSGYVELAAPNAAHNNTLELGPGTKILTDKNTHTGSIGFGTDNPATDFHIHSPSSGTNSEILLTNGDTGSSATDGFKIALNTGAGGEIWNYENDYIRFGTNNAERLRILSGGQVIIGDSASDLSGTHTFMACGSKHALQFDGNTGTYLSFTLGSANGNVDIEADARSGGYPDLTFTTYNDERLRITSGGKIGIGITNPEDYDSEADDLVIGSGGADTGITVVCGSGVGSHGSIFFADGTSSSGAKKKGQIRYEQNNEIMSFHTNEQQRLTIDLSGNVTLGYAGNSLYFQNGFNNRASRIQNGGASGSANLKFYTNNAGTEAERLRIDANGRIGTNGRAPSSYNNPDFLISGDNATLTIMGDGSTNNSSIAAIKFRVAGASTGDYTKAAIFAKRISGYNDLDMIFAMDTAADANGVNLGNEKMRLTSAGNLGVGNADPTQARLVAQTASGMSIAAVKDNTGASISLGGVTQPRILMEAGASASQFKLYTASGSSYSSAGWRQRLQVTDTNASVSSTGNGANGIGCFGIADNGPDSRALALSIGGGNGAYGLEDPRPLVYLQRSYGIGGGSSTDEITLEINAPGSYNSAGIIYGIKSRVQHNLNGSHYAGHFEAHGSQYSANGTSALYAKTTKLDTNGAGDVIAFRADASITQGSSNSGAAIAGYFASGNNVNGKPIVCQNGYTTNSYSNQIIFRKHNGSGIVDVGSIKSNNSNTQYNTSSDYRLKENIVSLTGAIDRLKQLQPKRFNFIGIDETIDGFIAHEVNPVAPYAVSGEKDAVKKELVLDEEGNEQFDEEGEIIEREVIDPQGVDYSKLTTLTIAALQEALAKIETLEAAVAALQGS